MAKTKANKKTLPAKEKESLLKTLQARFQKHMNRHKGIEWATVQARLEAAPAKLWTLSEMEASGGEPDVTGLDAKTKEIIFCDCSAESPKGRRSACYDAEGQASRKDFPPENNAMDLAEEMGVDMLTEEEYRELQALGPFDTKTSSWIKTPAHIRKLGGALFADYRFDTIFVYHNTAPSYYAARGFRGKVKV